MKVDVLREWGEFQAIGPEWDLLLGQSPSDTIFLTWEWLRAWEDVAGGLAKPLIVVVRDSGARLVGIAPFYSFEYRLLGTWSFRVLRIIGDQPWGGEYPDWILKRGEEHQTAQAIAAALRELGGEWDCLWMPSTSPRSGAHRRLSQACTQAGFRVRTRPCGFGYLDLPATLASYVSGLSRNRRRQLKSELNRISRGSATVSRCDSPQDLGRYLEALFELHGKRRALLGDVGAFRRKPAEAKFYRQFAPVAQKRGWLRIFGLEEGGTLRAVQYGYVYRNVFHQMQEGFDPEYHKGVGNVLRLRVIESLITEGVTGYDFLGEMTEHKRRWGAREEAGMDVFVGRAGIKTSPLFVRTLWPTGRCLRPAVPLDVDPEV